jgi:DNA-directed RNA polymerase subunit L
MEIEVLKEDKDGFEIKLKGEDHTFPNLVNTFLNRNKKVKYSAYKVEHPLIGEPKLFFRLKETSDVKEVPVGKVKGVGPKTAKQLESAGIKTASELILASKEKLTKLGISEKLLEKYLTEAKKMVPKDRFGYRAVLKETLSEVSKSIKGIKKEFKGAR